MNVLCAAFCLGSWEEPAVQRNVEALRTRLGRDVDSRAYVAVGDAEDVLDLVEVLRAVSVSKSVARPIAPGDEDFVGQTQCLSVV